MKTIPPIQPDPNCSKFSPPAVLRRLLNLALLACFTAACAAAQNGPAALAERSSIVILARVLKSGASDEPVLASSAQTAIVSVQKMYAGREIAGDQTGRTVTVILSRPGALKVGEEAVFYGNPRFLGKSLTIADESETPYRSGAPAFQAELERGSQARRDKPVVNRLAAASLVFRGSVETIQPLPSEMKSGEKERTSAPPTEHDADWHLASVRVTEPLQGGKAGQIVAVAFPASQDITWFNSPKLRLGQDAVFIVHLPRKGEEPLYRSSGLARLLEKQQAYLVTDPFDVLPAGDAARIRQLLTVAKENKR